MWLGQTVALLAGYYGTYACLAPFLLAPRSVQIKGARSTVTLTCIDANAMVWVGGILCGAIPLALLATNLGGVKTTAIALVFWFGFRVELRAKPGSAWLVRKFLYVIPWYAKQHRKVPRAYSDGWGDFVDPEALHVAFGEGESSLELGWGDKYSGTLCDELAERFNQAIAEMNDVSPGDAVT